MMGRPSKIDTAAAARVIEATRNGATREAAASAGPISRSTLYAWIRGGRLHESPEAEAFVAALDDADAAAELACVQAWTAAFPKDWRAAMMFLERRWPQRWCARAAEDVRDPEQTIVITDDERAAALLESIERSEPAAWPKEHQGRHNMEASHAEMRRRGLLP